MCDLIRDVISCSVWSCDTDKFMFENHKKENMEIKEIFFYINPHLKDRLDI